MRLTFRWLPAALIAAACTAVPSPEMPRPSAAGPSPSLTDARWRLVELEGAPALAASAERAPGLRFAGDDARVSGFTTCNQLFGSYDLSGGGDRLRLTDLAMTKMACVDPALARQEQRFLGVLRRVDRFAIAADTLTVFEGTRPLARFVAEPPR